MRSLRSLCTPALIVSALLFGVMALPASEKNEPIVQSKPKAQPSQDSGTSLPAASSKPLPQSRERFRGKRLDAQNPNAASTSLPDLTRPGTLLKGMRALQKSGLTTSASLSNMPGLALRPSMPTAAIPTDLATADLNGDGNADFVVPSGLNDELWVYLGKGDGTFQLPRIVPLTQGVSPIALKIADLRGNNIQDLIVANVDSNSIGVLQGFGDGTFSTEYSYELPSGPTNLTVADFDGDGRLDIVAALNYPISQYYFLAGTGNGGFKPATPTGASQRFSWINSLLATDLNRDGKMDLIDVGDGVASVYLGNGDGTLQAGQAFGYMTPDSYLDDAALADYNEDGCTDVALIERKGYVTFYDGRCDGSLHFAEKYVETGDGGAKLKIVDVNGDGHLDIVAAGFYGGHATLEFSVPYSGTLLTVSLGDGKGGFSLGRVYRGDMDMWGLGVADFNNDGHIDAVAASQYADTAILYTNDGTGHFGFPEGMVTDRRIWSNSIDFGDVNGDGTKDIVYINTDNSAAVTLNDGTGRFSDPAFYALPLGNTYTIGDFKIADFRNTGRADILAIGLDNYFSFSWTGIVFLPNLGDGTYGKAVLTNVPNAYGKVGVADFNKDGKLDFVTAGLAGAGHRISFFAGNGDGTFTPGESQAFVSVESPLNLYVGDFNQDSNPDFIVYFNGNGNWMATDEVWEFLGKGDGTFQPARKLFTDFEPFTMADVNNDGRPDIIRVDFSFAVDGSYRKQSVRVYICQPDGSFVLRDTYSPYAGYQVSPTPFWQSGTPYSAVAADYNGDGNVDIAVYQTPTPYSSPVYVQYLAGNGDGSFTPTYDIFELKRSPTPSQVPADLDGDGRAEIVEMNELRLSMHVIKTAPAPPFQIALEDSRITGSSSRGWLVLNVPGAAASVTLSSSDPAVIVPDVVNIAAGEISKEFAITVGKAANFRQLIAITAQYEGASQTAYASLSYVVGFEETVIPPDRVHILRGQTTKPYTLRIRSADGYATTVALTCKDLPFDVTCNLVPTLSVPANGEATTTFTFTIGAQASDWWVNQHVTIEATDGRYTKRAEAPISFVEFGVNIASGVHVPVGGGTVVLPLSINGIQPYEFSCSGLPEGTSWTMTGEQADLPSTSFLTLTINVGPNVAPGTYAFKLNVTSNGMTKAVDSTFVVDPPPDFTVSVENSRGRPMFAGETVPLWGRIEPLFNFSGSVVLTCESPAGLTCSTQTPVEVTSWQAQFPGKVTAALTTPPGKYTVTVKATAGQITRTGKVDIEVVAVTASVPPVPILKRGSTAVVTATITASAGATGTLVLSCSAPAQVTCTIAPPTIVLAGAGTTSVQLTVMNHTSIAAARQRKPHPGLGAFLAVAVLGMCGMAIRRKPSLLGLLIGGLLIAFLSSCGGGNQTAGNPGGGGTPTTSTQTVSITASGFYIDPFKIGEFAVTVER